MKCKSLKIRHFHTMVIGYTSLEKIRVTGENAEGFKMPSMTLTMKRHKLVMEFFRICVYNLILLVRTSLSSSFTKLSIYYILYLANNVFTGLEFTLLHYSIFSNTHSVIQILLLMNSDTIGFNEFYFIAKYNIYPRKIER